MGKLGGVRQRLGLDSHASSSDGPNVPETPSVRGGIKRRVGSSEVQPSVAPKAKGGVRSRVEKASQVDRAYKDSQLPFKRTMRQDWSAGKLTAPQVLKYCSQAAAQGAYGLGGIAGHTTLANAHRDLVRALGWPESAPEIDWIEIPKGPDGFMAPHPIIRPTCVFEHLIQKDEELFNKIIRGPEGDISDYWDNLRGHVCVQALGDLIGPKTVPIAMHGDGAPTHKTEGLFTVSWASNTVKAPTIDSKIIYTCIKKGMSQHKVQPQLSI